MLNNIIHKIHYTTFLLLACFPLLNAKVVPILIILWLVVNISLGIYVRLKKGFDSVKPLLIQSSLFIVILIWTLFIDKSKEAHFYLERSLSLIAFPVGFYFNPIIFTKKQFNYIKLTFVGATILITLLSSFIGIYGLIAKVGEANWYPEVTDLFKADNFHYHYRTAFEKVSNLHPTYASIYLGVSFIFILDLLINYFSQLSLKLKIFKIISLFIILILTSALASRTPFVAIILVSILYLFVKFKKKIYVLYAVLVSFLIALTMFFTIPSFSARFSQISFSNTALPTQGVGDSFNLRAGIFYCTTELIKDNWMVGVGPGKVQNKLNSCYMSISPETYKDRSFNTHNQYLDYWAGMGIVGLLSFLLILYSNFKTSLVKKHYLSLFLCLFFCLCFLTENIMIRLQGIVVVTYFINLFYFFNKRVNIKEKK